MPSWLSPRPGRSRSPVSRRSWSTRHSLRRGGAGPGADLRARVQGPGTGMDGSIPRQRPGASEVPLKETRSVWPKRSCT
jgi:hypothetical protein